MHEPKYRRGMPVRVLDRHYDRKVYSIHEVRDGEQEPEYELLDHFTAHYLGWRRESEIEPHTTKRRRIA